MIGLCLLGAVFALSINAYVVNSTKKQILSADAAAALSDVDCILVLGCYVHPNGQPSAMLHDRLQQSVDLYDAGAAPKLLMSGDHGQEGYNEVGAMKQYAMDAGVPSEDIFMDHAGFSTYESLYRAKEVFGVDKILIVTQKYHLYRALHIADALGMEAYGVAADYRTYYGQWTREIREVLARVKDFGTGIFKPKPSLLGDPIPITGNGNITND
jgi:vancomycin permeability regulator SanA